MTTESLSSLISGLGATLKTAKDVRKVYDRDLALDFNPILSFWRVGENKLSEILAFFLNPNESHGQGTIFLDSFLKSFFPNLKVPAYTDLHIQCEYPTPDGRRLDIHLDFDKGSLGIGIENKIWAKDQPRQLADYSNFLENQHKGNYCLLYLTPYNTIPDENSITTVELDVLKNNGKYFCNDHSSGISTLLEEWIKICQAEKVRIFLKNLHQFIQHEINGETFMGQNEIIADYVSLSSERLETTLALLNAKEHIYMSFLGKLRKDTEQIANELNIKLKDFNLSWEKQTCFTFEVPGENGKCLWLRFELEFGNYHGFYYGILTNEQRQPWLEKQLENHLGPCDEEGPSQWWAWWRYHEEKEWNEQTFIKIVNGTFTRDLKRQISDIVPKVKEVLKNDASNFW